MARVPITVMGFRCDRCTHEWIPRGGVDDEPMVCPKCHSPWWNRPPKKAAMTYDEFKQKIAFVLNDVDKALTWTEIRTTARLPQLFPNNQWVHRLEKDIRLIRRREGDGTIHWEISKGAPSASAESTATAEATRKTRTRSSRKQSIVE
jgi:hypothetical protein